MEKTTEGTMEVPTKALMEALYLLREEERKNRKSEPIYSKQIDEQCKCIKTDFSTSTSIDISDPKVKLGKRNRSLNYSDHLAKKYKKSNNTNKPVLPQSTFNLNNSSDLNFNPNFYPDNDLDLLNDPFDLNNSDFNSNKKNYNYFDFSNL